MLDQIRLASRAAGRKQGKDAVALLQELAPPAGLEETILTFWEEIRDFALKQAPLPYSVAEPRRAVPMDFEEMQKFEHTVCPLKKHFGTCVARVPLRYLDYMVGLRDDPDDFLNKAKRYLARPDVAARLANEEYQP